MLAQKSGGSVVTITAALAANPIAGIPASVPMITKGGLETVTLSLASRIRETKNPLQRRRPRGVVDTPMHKDNPRDFLATLSPMGTISTVEDVADAVLYLTEARPNHRRKFCTWTAAPHSGKWVTAAALP